MADTPVLSLDTMNEDDFRDFLEPKLDEQCEAIQGYQDYYDGKHHLQMATAKFREAFSRYFPALANNWMQIIVDAPVSRLTVQGFRFNSPQDAPAEGTNTINGQTPPWELDADEDAWSIWQANNLDSISRMVHCDAIKLGCAYALVSPKNPKKPTGQFPRITPEHASQCFVYSDPEDRRDRIAGFKRWVDDVSGYAFANLYMPDQIVKWRSENKWKEGKKIIWVPNGSVSNPIGVVPLIPFENKPDLQYGGRSDLEQAIPIQDAINKFCLDMQVSSEFHAYPQRYATGWERAVDNAGRELGGREVEVYLSAARMIRAESGDVKFGQFAQGNVENYLKPIDEYVDHLAAQTQTPLYYLKGKMAAMSADAMHAQDQGLVDRCKGKILAFSDSWEETLRAAFLSQGDTKRGTNLNAESIWADPESKSLAVLVQAAMIMRTQLSVPIEMCWQMLGWSPQQIRLARDIMNLPPGGAMMAAAIAPDGTLIEGVGAEEPNDPNQHPGNQPGQPAGQAGGGAKSQLAQIRASLPVSRNEAPG